MSQTVTAPRAAHLPGLAGKNVLVTGGSSGIGQAIAVRFDLDALTASATSLLMVPIFLLALLTARGLPAVVYRGALDARHTAIAGLLQATSLPFIVAATAIGRELDLIDAAASAALIGAGLLSVVLFPLGGLVLLRRAPLMGMTGGARP